MTFVQANSVGCRAPRDVRLHHLLRSSGMAVSRFLSPRRARNVVRSCKAIVADSANCQKRRTRVRQFRHKTTDFFAQINAAKRVSGDFSVKPL